MPHSERSFREAPNQDASVRPDTASAGHADSTQKSAGLSLQSDDFGFGRRAGTVPTGPDPLIGAACGDVVIERQVGEGGMGRVYVGLQQRPSRRVAVKVMRPDVMTAANAQRLHREADFLGGLQHPGIAQVFSAGTHTDAQGALQPYVILEYLPNARTIVEWCGQQRLPEQVRLTLLLEACRAIAHAHGRGVVHRDLKPSNILIDEEGRLKIVDFGVASRVDVVTTATNPADSRKVVGTLAYMSPEQRDGAAVDARSDVYSLGIVAAELLTDSPPAAALAAIMKRGDGVGLLVRRCLEFDPRDRYPSAESLATDLQHLVATAAVGPRPSLRRPRLRTLLIAALVLECLALLAMLLRDRFAPSISKPLAGPLAPRAAGDQGPRVTTRP